MFSRTQQIAATAIMSLGLAGGVSAAALAAAPVKGATYVGEGHGAGAIGDVGFQFKVSANGASVSTFEMPLGFAPGIGDEPCVTVPFVKSGGSAISKSGAFKLMLTLYGKEGQPSKEHVGILVVTGKFAAGGKVTGKMEEKFNSRDKEFPSSCDATIDYSAKAKR